MTKATIIFTGCIQDSQEYGSNDDYMVSRLFFSLQIGDKEFSNLHCDIKQIAGSDIENTPIEVGPPIGYKGPFNYAEFRKAAEKYFRSLVGQSGTAIRIGNKAKNIRMYNNRFERKMEFSITIDDDSGGW